MTATVISFTNQKGGVAKTTSVTELGELLAGKFGQRVLLIDNDAQATLTSFKTDIYKIMDSDVPTMADVMTGDIAMKDIIIKLKSNLWLAPTTLKLSDSELNLTNMTLRELVLSKALRLIIDDFDFVLIDCPPARGLLTINALSASDYVIIPVAAEYAALLGMQLMKNTIHDVQEQINDGLKTLGYLITLTDHTNHSKDAVTSIQHDSDASGINVIGSVPRKVAVKDAEVANMPTIDYDPEDDAGLAYYRLAKSINDLRK